MVVSVGVVGYAIAMEAVSERVSKGLYRSGRSGVTC